SAKLISPCCTITSIKISTLSNEEKLFHTASEIAGSLLTHLEREGSLLDAKTLTSVVETYAIVASDFVRRYQDVAYLNGLPFDLARETRAAQAFTETLSDVCGDFLRG